MKSAKSVCVIGAGVSGLAATKELRARGIAVDCFEMMPRIGGVFASHVWRGGQLTSSSVFTWYSDFPPADRQRFFTWEELLEYLERYVERFGLREHIHLDSKVESVRREGEGWRVVVRRGNWSNGHPFHPRDHHVPEERIERCYDHIVLCAGLHQAPSIPPIPGLGEFRGRVLHSSEYRDEEEFRSKQVVVVGSGESASDIALQIARTAARCTVSLRSPPGTLFPRWIQGNTPDIRDDRATYDLPRVLAPLVLRKHRDFYYAQTERPDLFRWAADSNFGNNRCPFNTNACKSFGIPEAIIDHGAALRGPIARLEGGTAHFADGSRVEADAVIFCTGFTRSFPFLDARLSSELVGIRDLWKNVVHPQLGDALFLVGFSRPQQINLISVAEMQSRLVAEVVAGRPLPEAAAMEADIRRDQAFMRRYYGDRYEKNPALVDYLYYMEGLARFIGCEVPLARAWLRDPALGFKLLCASMSGAHYRLVGPGADWDAAARTIKATPLFNNKRNAILRWGLIAVLSAYSRVRGLVQDEWRPVSRQARG